MNLARKLRRAWKRLRKSMDRLLPIGLICLLLGACGNMANENKTTKLAQTQVTTTSQMLYQDARDIDGLMTYLGLRGFTYDSEMEIAGLESGFIEGRKFRSEGVNYAIYRFDDSNESLNASLEQAKITSRMRMKVGSAFEEVPVFIADNYLVTYPEGADITVLRGHFQ